MINNKLSEISQLRELACSLQGVQNNERVQSTPNMDKIGTAYAKIDDMERNLDKLIDEYSDERNKIIGMIDGMENETYYEILFARYIEKKTFEVIATEMHYSFRNVTRLHGKALKAFDEKYGANYR
jgi:DNA-directed RNA polymerase specialized sigma subunit